MKRVSPRCYIILVTIQDFSPRKRLAHGLCEVRALPPLPTSAVGVSFRLPIGCVRCRLCPLRRQSPHLTQSHLRTAARSEESKRRKTMQKITIGDVEII